MWNSTVFNPVAPASECHFDFQTATDCSYELVKPLAPATPEKVEDIFASMRSHLLRIIQRWEQSGQGEGGRDNDVDAEEDEEDEASVDRMIGSLSGRPARALQSRAAFLNGKPSYVLYFWEIANCHQLLQSSLQQLSNSTGASDASCAPSVSSNSSCRARRRREREEDIQDESRHRDEEDALLHPLVESIKDFVDSVNQDGHRGSEIEEHRRVSDMRAQSADRRFQRRAELSDLARKYRRLNAELDPNADQKSKRLSEFYISEGLEIEKEICFLDGNNEDA